MRKFILAISLLTIQSFFTNTALGAELAETDESKDVGASIAGLPLSPTQQMLAGHWTAVRVACPVGTLAKDAELNPETHSLGIRFYANDSSRAHGMMRDGDGCSVEFAFTLIVDGDTIKLTKGREIRKVCPPGQNFTITSHVPDLKFQLRKATTGEELVISGPDHQSCKDGNGTLEMILVRSPDS